MLCVCALQLILTQELTATGFVQEPSACELERPTAQANQLTVARASFFEVGFKFSCLSVVLGWSHVRGSII